MLTREENELMCQTDKGTPMGEFCRRFWTPVLLMEELPEPDCAPVQTRIYGEDLVAFRDSSGRVGLLEEFCPHRLSSLFYGRNEQDGLRCIYHGWKFDVDGNCVDQMSEPDESNFKDKVHTTAYPTFEGAGMIWAYMGPPELKPPMPELECLLLPPDHTDSTKIRYESNFVQVIEGEIDTVHSSILHSVLSQHIDGPTTQGPDAGLGDRYHLRGRPPEFTIQDTDGGIVIGARRDAEEDSSYWRISQWLFPWITMPPAGGYNQNPPEGKNALRGPIRAAFLVPIDDENCWFFMCSWHPYKPYQPDELPFTVGRGNPSRGVAPEPFKDGLIPDGSWLGKANKHNNYMMDREEQRTYSFAGIPFNNGRAQDAAMTDSMGASTTATRWREHLGTTDAAIIRMRRRLIQGARDLQEGIEPYAASHPKAFRVRSGQALIPRGVFFTDDPDTRDSITVSDVVQQAKV